ncbi:MAG TPA: exosortase system-associated protein, TIGR04073 family [Sumerlaeia bacterium]|nr:exosortase system-associated protein, TIGR04073 family [Sumerlaeia bacterium]
MRKRLGICAIVAALFVSMGLVSTPSASAADELYRDSSEVQSMMTKLGRGCTNILTGWMEMPKQMAKSIRETDPVTGTIVGAVRGMGWTFARTVTGAFEVVTFPFPVPKDYKPLLEPEYIVTDMWGDALPIVCDPDSNARNMGR